MIKLKNLKSLNRALLQGLEGMIEGYLFWKVLERWEFYFFLNAPDVKLAFNKWIQRMVHEKWYLIVMEYVVMVIDSD